jgi:two-component system OmpR family sensor kinase
MRSRWPWALAFLPVASGLLVTVLVLGGQLENLTFYLEGGIVLVAPLLGAIVSAVFILILLIRSRLQGSAERTIDAIRSDLAAERRRFLQRLDHELKNPLTAIRAGLTNLSWLPTEEARSETLASVEGQALRLSRLAADLRKLADLETRSLERSPVQIADLLQEVIETAHERPEADQIRLNLSVPQAPWPLPVIQGDPDLLFLAVHNLVDNALKFTAAGDTVEVRAFEDDATILIEVADTGPGIPDEEVDHVWDELFRGQGARGIPGSGLGLSLARAIVERHGGRVTLRSRRGQGTVFTIRIPVR